MRKPLGERIKEYLASEQKIHDYLIFHGDEVCKIVRKAALRGDKLNPFLIFWPSERVAANSGAVIEDMILMPLESNDPALLAKHLKGGAARTKAYAVMHFSPAPDLLKLVLESKHGTETWTMPRQRRGDVEFVKEPKRLSNVDSLGVIQMQS